MMDIHKERNIIVKSMAQVDRELSGLKRNAPKRAELVRQKQILLMELLKIKTSSYHMEQSNEVISDHAVLRWLERKHGINIKRIRDTMLTDGVRDAISDNPVQKTFWSDGDVVFVIEGSVVRTVIPVHMLTESEAA